MEAFPGVSVEVGASVDPEESTLVGAGVVVGTVVTVVPPVPRKVGEIQL